MARKSASTRMVAEEPAVLEKVAAEPAQAHEAGKKLAGKGAASLDDLTRTALRAFLIARDAAFNVRDLLTQSSRMAFLAIKDCEK